MRRPVALCSLICAGLFCFLASAGNAEETAPAVVVAKVNGKVITADQIQLQFFLDQLPEKAAVETQQQLIEKLIDRELIRQFLKSRNVNANAAQVDHQMAVIQKMVATRGEEIHDVFGKLHLTPERVKEVLALPLAWGSYVRSVVTEPQLQAEWEKHRQELDGTRVEASQIVRLMKPDAPETEWQAAETVLNDVRSQIESGKISFADAAKAHSQSPSAQRGGDLGEFEFRGRVDTAISKAAFETKAGSLSPVFRSRTGVHLVQTRSFIPGQLSLEDVRPQLMRKIGNELWNKQVQELRKKSRIQLVETP